MPLRKVILSIPRGSSRASPRLAAAAALSTLACACDPTVVIGARALSDAGGADSTVPGAEDDGATVDGALPDAGATDAVCATPGAAAGAVPDADVPVSAPWTTGFEDGFCDYAFPMGFCFATGGGAYTVVNSPVHSGQHAAAFSVQGTLDAGGSQARCVQQGVFPGAAYYGAWYYVPTSARNDLVWNLFHYQGGVPGQPLHGLWDVSLVNAGDGGSLHVTFFDFLNGSTPNSNAVPTIPLGQWFHLEVYFKRASDATGELSLWQDGVPAVHLTGLATDDTDWGQWYVGNYASDLVPPASTIYVDDVTIGFTP